MAVDYFSNPPPGLDLTESRTAANNATGIVLFVLSAIFVGLRWLTRVRYQRAGLMLDDWLMLVGLFLNAGNLACCISGGFFGLGKHIWSLGPEEMKQISLITFVYVFIYAWSVCIIKFSILALYRRIFGMTWLGWWCVFLTTGYLITNHVVLPLYTKPLNYYWDQWYPDAKGRVLVDEAKFYLGVGIINLVGDICILSVPITSVLKLHMSRPQKYAVCFMFLLGSFVCFASLYRIITISRLVSSRDISWAKSDVFIWSSVEPSIGIISGCLPTLRPLMMHTLKRVFGYVPRSVGSGGSSRDKRSKSSKGSHKIMTLETISQKRTRKIRRDEEVLDSHIGDDELDSDEQVGGGSMVQKTVFFRNKRGSQSGAWRPDEDEMCLTTTVIQGKEQRSSDESNDLRTDGNSGGSGIGQVVVTREFAWGEGQRDH